MCSLSQIIMLTYLTSYCQICIDIDELQLKQFSLKISFVNAFSRQLRRVYKYSLGIK